MEKEKLQGEGEPNCVQGAGVGGVLQFKQDGQNESYWKVVFEQT